MLDSIGSLFKSKKPTEIIGGVVLSVTRDNVEGSCYYLHPDDSNDMHVQGIFPYILLNPNAEAELRIKIQSGKSDVVSANEVVVNASGTILRHKKDVFSSDPTSKNGIYIPEHHHIDICCEEKWRMVLDTAASGGLVVVRFKRNVHHLSEEAKFDFAVSGRNNRMISDVLTAYSSLVRGGSDEPQDSWTTSTPAQAELPPTSGTKYPFGPFILWSDGSITDRDTSFRLPPDVSSGEFPLEGHVLKVVSLGMVSLVDSSGTIQHARYRNGRWEQKR